MGLRHTSKFPVEWGFKLHSRLVVGVLLRQSFWLK